MGTTSTPRVPPPLPYPYPYEHTEHTRLIPSPPPPAYDPRRPPSYRTFYARNEYDDDIDGHSYHKQKGFWYACKEEAWKVMVILAVLGGMVAMAWVGVWGWNLGWRLAGGEEGRWERMSVRVGVVGAGPAGIATAHAISKLPIPSHVDLHLTIFDQNSQIGGRMFLPYTSSINNSHIIHVEDVATACLSRNFVLQQRAKSELGVKYGPSSDSPPTVKVGFYKDKSIVAEITRPRSALSFGSWAKLVFVYGASITRAANLPTGTVNGFRKIFPLLGKRKGFKSIWEILTAADMAGPVGMGAMERLAKNGVGRNYIDDIVRPQTKRQSGSEVEDISDLALSYLLDREGQKLCGDDGGGMFQDLMHRFTTKSKAELKLNTKVTGLKREFIPGEKEAWVVEYILSNGTASQNEYEIFDYIILAAPWNSTLFVSQPLTIKEEMVYRDTYITFITTSSKLTSTNLNLSPSINLPDQLLPIIPEAANDITDLTFLRSIYSPASMPLINSADLYKISSQQPLSNETLEALWPGEIKEVFSSKIENAYAVPFPRHNGEGLGTFEVGKGVWWTGGGEAIVDGLDWAWSIGEIVGGLVGEKVRKL